MYNLYNHALLDMLISKVYENKVIIRPFMMVRQHVSHESSDLMRKKINIIKSYVNYMKKSLIMI